MKAQIGARRIEVTGFELPVEGNVTLARPSTKGWCLLVAHLAAGEISPLLQMEDLGGASQCLLQRVCV